MIEDDYFVAQELVSVLAEIGAQVVGPAGDVAGALRLIATQAVDAAVLDINLRGEMVFPVAGELRQRNIPFVFSSGYDRAVVPDAFGQVPRCEKPLDTEQVLSALGQRMRETIAALVDSPTSANLFDFLRPELREELSSLLEPVECDARDVLVMEDLPIRTVYFPETAVLTILAVGAEMRPIDVAMIGPEGMTDMAHFDGDCAPMRAVALVGGRLKQISAERLLSFASKSAEVQSWMSNYRETLSVQFAFAALAHGTMTIEGRLARFILMVRDRLQADEIPIVHNLIADVLAVRRSGITTALHVLEGMGAIKSVRGRIILRDRALLRQLANGSYGVAEREYLRMMRRGWQGEANLDSLQARKSA